MRSFIKRLVDLNAKEVRRIERRVDEINSFEKKMKKLKDKDFPEKTELFKKRLKKESLDDILPEAFALTREASRRVLGMRQYDVQLIAGVALYEGKIAEQKTGEGKTLSAAAPLYLRALAGRGAHLVTVNGYLARVGAGWNAPLYHFLGMSTGVIDQEQKSYMYSTEYSDTSHGDSRLVHLRPTVRREAYEADITYGTNNEFGFDYLRDNMVSDSKQMVQRGHYFAIVDEVDQVLIDEARTPLIISAPDAEPTDKYYKFAEIIGKLNGDTDYEIDEKARSATLTERGVQRVEKILGVDNLYEHDWEAIHHIENALRARSLYLRDREYLIKEGQVVIVDEFTGRLMPGRRWSDGLHQAVEAKEGVRIQQESKTLATISFQNYFRMYKHLSGMTGTAATEADEFRKIYKLDVVVIPTNMPVIRHDEVDSIYKTVRAKYTALVADIEKHRKQGQPILVGTTSVEKNEVIASLLKRKDIPYRVLNAKNHEREASTIADAGEPGAVTVATNMAGRGVDIVLGGAKPERGEDEDYENYIVSREYKKWEEAHKRVVKAGGLRVIGTERHESRRIDNQLRGRSGRQGDPGESKFYLSLEDDLMRIFGGEQIGGLMGRLRLPEDQPIENKLVSRAVQQSQVKVEGFHFDARKRLVEYDDVINQQREIIYKLRRRVLDSKSLKDEILDKLEESVSALAEEAFLEKVDIERALVGVIEIIPFGENSREEVKKRLGKASDSEELAEIVNKMIEETYLAREKQVGENVMRQIERFAYLGAIDHHFMNHIDNIDSLRESVGLRGYAQRDPLVEFKNEAFGIFEGLLQRIDGELARRIFRVQMERAVPEVQIDKLETNVDKSDDMGLSQERGLDETKPHSPRLNRGSQGKKIGRNDPCPCGSGKKYKKCGLINAPEHKG